MKGLGDKMSCNNGSNILKYFGTFEKRHTLNIIWWLLLGKMKLLFIPTSGHTENLLSSLEINSHLLKRSFEFERCYGKY